MPRRWCISCLTRNQFKRAGRECREKESAIFIRQIGRTLPEPEAAGRTTQPDIHTRALDRLTLRIKYTPTDHPPGLRERKVVLNRSARFQTQGHRRNRHPADRHDPQAVIPQCHVAKPKDTCLIRNRGPNRPGRTRQIDRYLRYPRTVDAVSNPSRNRGRNRLRH